MTELFGTLGPACSAPDILVSMFEKGMTGMRLNLSHTSLQEAEGLLSTYRQAAEKAGCEPELLIDLQGPELRIGKLKQDLLLADGAEVSLDALARRDTESIPIPEYVLKSMETGDHILLDDGRLELKITEIGAHGKARALVLRGGPLRSRKSLKIVGKYVEAPVLTEMDRQNLKAARKYGVTAVMQPFVTSGDDLRQLRKALMEVGEERLRIFAKIENMEGVRNIDEILPEADMIVIARGDLGNDMPLWELPAVQKRLSRICLQAGKPFLVVTQMLTSMIENPVPTRAEVSDIFNAVLDGASAVMATNETAAGKYPVEVIRVLHNTCSEAENYLRGEQ